MIERYKIDELLKDIITDGYELDLESFDSLRDIILEKPHLIDSIYEKSLRLSSYELYLNGDEGLSFAHLKRAAQSIYHAYNLALNSGKQVVAEIADFPAFSMEGRVLYDFVTPWDYADHLKIAFLVRDKETIKKMASFDANLFAPEKRGLSGPKFHYNYFEFLRELISGASSKEQLLSLLEECVKVAKEYYEDEARSYEETNFALEFSLMKSIFNNNSDELNRLLEKRLLAFKEYYSNEGSGLSSESLYSFLITGLAAFAYDQGLEITVESDYLPRFLIEGKYAKEKIKWPME